METYAIIITGKSELVNLFCAILSEKYIVELYRNSHDTKYQLFDQMNEENKVVFKIFMSAVNRLSDDISFIKDERGYKKCYKIYFSYDYNIHVSPSGYDFYMYWFDDCLMKDIRNNVEVIANKILRKFDQLNLAYIRNEIDGFVEFLDQTFGEGVMVECKAFLERLKKTI